MKRCKKCQQNLPLDLFHVSARAADGRQPTCKECACTAARKYHADKMLDPLWVEKERARNRERMRLAAASGTLKPKDKERKRLYSQRDAHKHPLHKQARRRVQSEILMGRMKPLPCEVCGESNTQAHHDDYSKPLDVQWLCTKHHGERHVELRRALLLGCLPLLP